MKLRTLACLILIPLLILEVEGARAIAGEPGAAQPPAEDSCSPIDLADPNPAIPVEKRPLSVIPIYQQGKTETCYAFGASELADAWRFSHGDTDFQHLTDPLVVAVAQQKRNGGARDEVTLRDGSQAKLLRYDPGNRKSSFQLGDPVGAFKAIQSEGSCPRSVISDRLIQRGPASDEWMIQHYDKFKKVFDEYEGYVDLRERTDRLGLEAVDLERQMAKEEGRFCTWMRDEYGIPASQLPDMGWIQSLLAQENPIILMDQMLSQACRASGKVKHLELPPMKIYEMSDYALVGASSPAEYARKMVAAQFNMSPPQPVGINMCADVFRKGGYSGFVQKSPGKYGLTHDCEQHVTVLAGRRRDSKSGKCQWIIRNSWGPKDCETKPWPNEVDGRKKWDCLHGDYLIDEDAVMKNLFSLEIYTANDPYRRQ